MWRLYDKYSQQALSGLHRYRAVMFSPPVILLVALCVCETSRQTLCDEKSQSVLVKRGF